MAQTTLPRAPQAAQDEALLEDQRNYNSDNDSNNIEDSSPMPIGRGIPEDLWSETADLDFIALAAAAKDIPEVDYLPTDPDSFNLEPVCLPVMPPPQIPAVHPFKRNLADLRQLLNPKRAREEDPSQEEVCEPSAKRQRRSATNEMEIATRTTENDEISPKDHYTPANQERPVALSSPECVLRARSAPQLEVGDIEPCEDPQELQEKERSLARTAAQFVGSPIENFLRKLEMSEREGESQAKGNLDPSSGSTDE